MVFERVGVLHEFRYYILSWLLSLCLRVATKSTRTSKARMLATSPFMVLYLPTHFTVCILPFTRPGSHLLLLLNGTGYGIGVCGVCYVV